MGNCACGPKGAASCVGFEQSTRDEGKKIAPVALGGRTPNEGSKISSNTPQAVHRQIQAFYYSGRR
eukprot:2684264-Pleurochrysis_carterae.AAC.1